MYFLIYELSGMIWCFGIHANLFQLLESLERLLKEYLSVSFRGNKEHWVTM